MLSLANVDAPLAAHTSPRNTRTFWPLISGRCGSSIKPSRLSFCFEPGDDSIKTRAG
jgi:hypothetical protein